MWENIFILISIQKKKNSNNGDLFITFNHVSYFISLHKSNGEIPLYPSHNFPN